MATYENLAAIRGDIHDHIHDRRDFQASLNAHSDWREQLKSRRDTIDRQLAEQIKERRRFYQNDLNDLFGKKERVISLPKAVPVKKQSAEEPEDEKLLVFCPQQFISPEQLDEAVEVALETGCRVHGPQEGVTKKDVLNFVKNTFQLTQEQIEQAEERSSRQPSKMKLMCKVVKATDLKSKHGHSETQRNPYCHVGIVNQKHYHPGSEFKTMAKWKKTGEIDQLVTTDYRTATLEPVWNQDLQLSVGNIEEDVVVVEVWDHSPEASAKKKRDWSLKGLLTSNKEDFLGWMFHPLLLVPIAGAELKFTLMSRGKKPLNGFITLYLSIQADTEWKPLEVRLGEHHLLTRALVDRFSKRDDGERKRNWNAEICSESESLLEYHGALNGLNKMQMTCVRFSELWKYHNFVSVDISAFKKVIKRMKQLQPLFPVVNSNGKSHDPLDIYSPSPPPYYDPTDSFEPRTTQQKWMEQLFSELYLLETELTDVLNDHICHIYFKLEGKPEKLDPYLSTLLELFTYEAFMDQKSTKKDLNVKLERCIELSVDSWFSMLKHTVMPSGGTEPKELRDLCVHCLTWTEKVIRQLHPRFIQAGVDYFTWYMRSLDMHLSEEAKKALLNYRKQKPDTITFEIYTNFQQLVKMSQTVSDNVRSNLAILGFHKWFKKFIPGWINVATEKCEARIRQAIELDEIVQITIDLKLSVSAVDTNGFLLQMANLWKHIDWPVASEAYCYAISLVEKTCNCASLFVREACNKLSPDDVCDENGSFVPSDKLCLVLNNMFHVREHLSKLPDHMELEGLYDWLQKEDQRQYLLVEDGGLEADEMFSDPLRGFNIKAKHMIKEFLTHADDDIMKTIDDLVVKICQSTQPDVQTLINGIVYTSSNERDHMVISPLFDYLTQNLVSLGGNLLPPAFESIAANLWRVSIDAIAEISAVCNKRSIRVHHRLFNILKLLREFFYCEGAGVSGRALDSNRYQSVSSKLEILAMPTNQLIRRFYFDILKQQHRENRGERKYSEILLSVGYVKETSTIEVTVIHGDNMKSVHEPYIKVRLSSLCKASAKHWKTKAVKGPQKSPLFNEDIKLSVTEEEMNSEGSVVLFHLLDRHVRNRMPLGMCAIACTSIPQVMTSTKSYALIDPLAPQRMNFRLQLFPFTDETPALTELMKRSGERDEAATNFVKVNQILLSGISSLNSYPLNSTAFGGLIHRTKSMIA